MKIDEMRLLIHIYKSSSMSDAASKMHLTPAAVSATVKRVEASLGVRVFERTTRFIHPTEDGLRVLETCQSMVAQWEHMLDTMREGPLKGTVYVSAPIDIAYQVIAPVMTTLSRRHPEIGLVLHSSDFVHHLHRDAIDMAVRYGPLSEGDVVMRRVTQWPGILVASPDYLERAGEPRELGDLHAHRVITLQMGGEPFTEWSLLGVRGPEEIVLRSPICADGYLARQWALDGEGITIKSVFDVIDDLIEGRLVRVLPDYATAPIPIHVLFPNRTYKPARVREFDALLAQAFQERDGRCLAWMSSRSEV